MLPSALLLARVVGADLTPHSALGVRRGVSLREATPWLVRGVVFPPAMRVMAAFGAEIRNVRRSVVNVPIIRFPRLQIPCESVIDELLQEMSAIALVILRMPRRRDLHAFCTIVELAR